MRVDGEARRAPAPSSPRAGPAHRQEHAGRTPGRGAGDVAPSHRIAPGARSLAYGRGMGHELQGLEESLWRPETRFDRRYMDGVLTPDFLEFGRSGRRYDRAGVLDMTGGHLDARLSELTVTLLAPDVALVTYVSEVRGDEVLRAQRSSVWLRQGGSWRLRFHQGTPL